MKIIILIKRDKNRFLRNGVQLMYVRMDSMWLVFANEKNFMQNMKGYKQDLV